MNIPAPGRRLVVAISAWTLLVWLTRVRNIVGDDDLGAGGRAGRLLVAAAFVVGASALMWARWYDARRLRAVFAVLATWTVGYWLVRSVSLLATDHSGAFKAVHTVLAVVSIALVALAWRGPRFSPVRVHG